ncbi:MAG: hypothetical protein AB9836_04775 [Aminipila sp.]
MRIVKINGLKFGTKQLYVITEGYALYEDEKGFIAFSNDRDKFGILAPYAPHGGKMALQNILDAGGFVSFDGMEYVNAI